MPKVSVIIPVYNVEKYLAQCLDSVINQTLKDIEIICINDGSTDDSLKILQDYAKKDDRIKVINQDNMGVSVARNKGIKSAKGEFICFVDADDFLQPDTCELTLNQILKTNADICCFGINEVINKKVTPRAWEKYFLDSCENKEFDLPTIKCFLCNACGKLFRASFIHEHTISFPIGIRSGEDSIFNLECLFFSPKYTLVNKYLYNYVKDRNDSASHSSANLIKYDIEGFKYFFATPLFKNASEELQLIALEKFVGQIMYYYDNEKKYRLKYLREIASFRKYLKNNFSKELLSNVSNIEELNKTSIISNVFSSKNSPNKKHKIITILGIKLKFKRKKKND